MYPVLSQETNASLVSDCRYLWQMKLLDANNLSRLGKQFGFRFSDQQIIRLWKIGLLSADIILSEQELEEPGFIEIEPRHDNTHTYSDQRSVPLRPEGWGDVFDNMDTKMPIPQLLFHPFRCYVLHHLQDMLRPYIHPMQFLRVSGYPGMLDLEIERFQRWSSSEQFQELITKWNDIVAVAVITEPIAYQKVFYASGYSPQIGEEAYHEIVEQFYEKVAASYSEIGLKTLEAIRHELCVDAELLDKNWKVRMLLRLSSLETRSKLKGAVGGAMQMQTMAEMIRRVAEPHFDTQLPEEDEIGLGRWPEGARKQIFGSDRILDRDRGVALQFVRQFVLDFGTRLRWYVEGDTEYGAIRYILDRFPLGIEVRNLRGRFVESKSKGVSFRESLREDKRIGVFSFISLDGDEEDNVRVVKRAADDDEFCGRIYISEPDFEFQNFEIEELEEILWEIAEENGADPADRPKILEAIQDTENGKDLIKAAQNSLEQLEQTNKGIEWGERLAEYAWENESFRNGEKRPFVSQIDQAMGADLYDFHLTSSEYRVDSETGDLVKRKT